jgi:hypothetical protein
VVTEFFAEPSHVGVDRAGIDGVAVAPDFLKKILNSVEVRSMRCPSRVTLREFRSREKGPVSAVSGGGVVLRRRSAWTLSNNSLGLNGLGR